MNNNLPILETYKHNTQLSDENIVDLLKTSSNLHMDQYGGKRLNYGCIHAERIYQTLLKICEPNKGVVYKTIDASGGYGSACLGANPAFFNTISSKKIFEGGYVTDEIYSLPRAKLLDYLFGKNGCWTQNFTYGEYHVSGRSSGSEGMELALRLALESRQDHRNLNKNTKKSLKNRILSFEGAWHGWTHGLLPLINRRHFNFKLPQLFLENNLKLEFSILPFGKAEILEDFFKEHGNSLLAVVVEPIQGDAGIILPPIGYLRYLQGLCKKYDAILIADEVLTFAKTGKFFAMNDEEGPIKTDITVIGKSLGMGIIPVSMVIAKKEFNVRACGAVATTDLRPLTCTIIEKGIQYIFRENLLEKSYIAGKVLRETLQKEVISLFPDIYAQVRGMGFLNGIELNQKSAMNVHTLRQCMIENGVYVEFMSGAGKRSNNLSYVFPTMRIAPPLITNYDEIKNIVECISKGSRDFLKITNKL